MVIGGGDDKGNLAARRGSKATGPTNN